MCHVENGENLGDVTYDAKLFARTVWEIEDARAEVKNGACNGPRDRGLANTPSPLESSGLIFDVTQQIPPEPLHALLLGIGLVCLSVFIKSLTSKWKDAIGAILRLLSGQVWSEKFPPLKLSKKNRLKMNAEEISRTIQLLPFALSWPAGDRIGDWLEERMFTAAARTGFEELNVGNAPTSIRQAFILLAAANVAVFGEERANDEASLNDIQQRIDAAIVAMTSIFGQVLIRPNTHTLSAHLVDAARMYATPKNFDVRALEAKHAPFRRFISRSSNLAVERQMLMWANVQQAIQFVKNGGDANQMIPDDVLSLLRSDDAVFAQLLDRSYKNPHDLSVPGSPFTNNITWGKSVKGEVNLTEYECWVCEVDLDDVIVSEVSFVVFEDVSRTSLRICQTEFWLIEVHDSRLAPAGPRAGYGLAKISQVLRINDIPFVRVRWYGKTNYTQPSTQCDAYAEKQNPRFQTIMPAYSVARRIHMVQHGPLLLLNKYFLK